MHGDPQNHTQTAVLIFSNKQPYNLLQKIIIQYETEWTYFSIERRNTQDQAKSRSIFVGLNAPDASNKVAKLQFEDEKCKEVIEFSDEVKEDLLQCHTMDENFIVAFH